MTVDIRVAKVEDAAGVLGIYAPFCESTRVSFEIVAPSVEEMRERIQRIGTTYPWIVAEEKDWILGYVYASRLRERAAYQWTVEVAVYVAPEHQRRGLARALYTCLFAILRAQGFFKAFASVTLPNEASIGVHEALGFRPAGVFSVVGYKTGKWLDVGWWQRDLQPAFDNPPEPQSFPAIRGDVAVAAALGEGVRLANRSH